MKRYWLLKTEPSSYSIETLKEQGVGVWDGVRNYQARNFLRDMESGDKVIIFHSSIAEPATAGLGEVVGDSFPDPAQFNPKSKYFDPKAKLSKPIWTSRRIKYLKTFKNGPKIGEMRGNPGFGGMVLLRKGMRLSVQPVSRPHFELIIKLGN